MKGKYQAAFIIPVGASKLLNDGGWEFEGSNRLSEKIKDYLIKSLKLRFLESYLGIESYVDSNIKMSVVFDDKNKIESFHFQLYEDALAVLMELCQSGRISSEAELFIPCQGPES